MTLSAVQQGADSAASDTEGDALARGMDPLSRPRLYPSLSPGDVVTIHDLDTMEPRGTGTVMEIRARGIVVHDRSGWQHVFAHDTGNGLHRHDHLCMRPCPAVVPNTT